MRYGLLFDYLRGIGQSERIFFVSDVLRRAEKGRAVLCVELNGMVDLYLKVNRVHGHIPCNVEPVCVFPALEYVFGRCRRRLFSFFRGRSDCRRAVFDLLHARLIVAVNESYGIFSYRLVKHSIQHGLARYRRNIEVDSLSVFVSPVCERVSIFSGLLFRRSFGSDFSQKRTVCRRRRKNFCSFAHKYDPVTSRRRLKMHGERIVFVNAREKRVVGCYLYRLAFSVLVCPAVVSVIELSGRRFLKPRRVRQSHAVFPISYVLHLCQKRYAVFCHEAHGMIIFDLDIYRVDRDILSHVEPVGTVPAFEYVFVFRRLALFKSLSRLCRARAVFNGLLLALSVAVIENYRELSERFRIACYLGKRARHGCAFLSLPAVESIVVFFVAVRSRAFGESYCAAVSKVVSVLCVLALFVLSYKHDIVIPYRFIVLSDCGHGTRYVFPRVGVPTRKRIIEFSVACLSHLLGRRLSRRLAVFYILRFAKSVAVLVYEIYRIYPDYFVVSRRNAEISRNAGEICVPARKYVVVLICIVRSELSVHSARSVSALAVRDLDFSRRIGVVDAELECDFKLSENVISVYFKVAGNVVESSVPAFKHVFFAVEFKRRGSFHLSAVRRFFLSYQHAVEIERNCVHSVGRLIFRVYLHVRRYVDCLFAPADERIVVSLVRLLNGIGRG